MPRRFSIMEGILMEIMEMSVKMEEVDVEVKMSDDKLLGCSVSFLKKNFQEYIIQENTAWIIYARISVWSC